MKRRCPDCSAVFDTPTPTAPNTLNTAVLCKPGGHAEGCPLVASFQQAANRDRRWFRRNKPRSYSRAATAAEKAIVWLHCGQDDIVRVFAVAEPSGSTSRHFEGVVEVRGEVAR